MENNQNNKKVFITGISSGIGRSLAISLVKSGYQVWGLARRQDLLEKLKKELGGNLTISVCDLAVPSQIEKISAEMKKQTFIPDIIVLNAAVQLDDVGRGHLFDHFENALKTNVEGALFWVSEFLPEFQKRNHGLFVAISSTSAHRPTKGSISYPMTKAAMSMAFRGLRLNHSDSKVRFSTISFGPINTAMWRGKTSFLIPSPDDAARFIISVFSKKSGSYFYPAVSTAIFRIASFLPDKTFAFFSDKLRPKNAK